MLCLTHSTSFDSPVGAVKSKKEKLQEKNTQECKKYAYIFFRSRIEEATPQAPACTVPLPMFVSTL